MYCAGFCAVRPILPEGRAKEPLLHRLVPVVVREMGTAYPN